MNRIASLAIAAALAMSGAAQGQDRPDFSGRWVMDKAQSKEHRPDQFRRRVMVVEHAEPHLDVTIQAATADGGEFRAYLDFRTDGEPAEVVLGGRQQLVARWQESTLEMLWNMKRSTEQRSGAAPGRGAASPPFVWTWLLSPDGNTLTNRIVVFGDVSGEINESLVFKRERQ